jgi:SAM-dependent methyltransferase
MSRVGEFFDSFPEIKKRLKDVHSTIMGTVGYNTEPWARVVRRREWHQFLQQESAKRPLDILEISPGPESLWRPYATGSYTGRQWPDFDITRERLPQSFDVIIAEEVFEHLEIVDTAADNVRAMLKPEGVFLVSVPFLIKIHGPPIYGDFRRWTPVGLNCFLTAHGFGRVDVRSWGNAKAVIANIKKWKSYGFWKDLRNDPELPVAVWAYARP